MATLLGTNGDDSLRVDDIDALVSDTAFGLRGDDDIVTGRGQDSLFGGPGSDRLDGGRQIDYYHWILGSGDDLIEEWENADDLNGSAQNNADRLRFWTPDTDHTDETFLDLEHITDAFLVLQGETLNTPTPVSDRIEYGAFFYTRGDSLQIEDQYGVNDGNTPPDPDDSHDGIEYISLKYLNFLGNRTTAEFRFHEDQSQIEARNQRGDDLVNDLMIGSRGDDSFFGRGGQDLIFTGAGDDAAYGGSSSDHIHASKGDNMLFGGDNSDYYYWNREFRARNTIEEDSTSTGDIIAADFEAAGLNSAVAEAGNLRLGFAKASNPKKELSSFRIIDQFDTLPMVADYDVEHIRFAGKQYDLQQDLSTSGTDGNDFIAMTATGSETIRAGGGDDVVFANGGKDNVKGQSGDDILDGGGKKDRLAGGGGDDMLRGGGGADKINGGGGVDTADYRNSGGAVNVNLSNTKQKSGEARGDMLRGIENVNGSENGDKLRGDGGDNELSGRGGADLARGGGGRDVILGNDGADRGYGGGGRDDIRGGAGKDKLWGDGGNDKIWGGGGNDKIWGNGGNDKLWGDGGRDTFYVGPGRDRILDYTDGKDKIAFSGADKPGSMKDLRITKDGSDVVVRWDGGRVDIDDVDRSDLKASDFLF